MQLKSTSYLNTYPLWWVIKSSIIIVSILFFNSVNIYCVYGWCMNICDYIFLMDILFIGWLLYNDFCLNLWFLDSVLYNANTPEENTLDLFWFLFEWNIFLYPIISSLFLFVLVKLKQIFCWQFIVVWFQIYTTNFEFDWVLCRGIDIDLFSLFYM